MAVYDARTGEPIKEGDLVRMPNRPEILRVGDMSFDPAFGDTVELIPVSRSDEPFRARIGWDGTLSHYWRIDGGDEHEVQGDR